MAQLKVAGSFKKSTEMLADMNKLVSLREVSENMQAMQKEMMKAEMIEDHMNDVMDGVLDEDSDEVDEEVDNIVEQITEEALKGAKAGKTNLPAKEKTKVAEEAEDEQQQQDV